MPLILRGIFRKERNRPLAAGKLTLPQCLALDIVDTHQSLRMKDIAQELGVSLPAATGIIDRLVRMRMVKRLYNEADRRTISIALTVKGKNVLHKIRSLRRKTFEEIFSKLTDLERLSYLAVLRKVLTIINQERKDDKAK